MSPRAVQCPTVAMYRLAHHMGWTVARTGAGKFKGRRPGDRDPITLAYTPAKMLAYLTEVAGHAPTSGGLGYTMAQVQQVVAWHPEVLHTKGLGVHYSEIIERLARASKEQTDA